MSGEFLYFSDARDGKISTFDDARQYIERLHPHIEECSAIGPGDVRVIEEVHPWMAEYCDARQGLAADEKILVMLEDYELMASQAYAAVDKRKRMQMAPTLECKPVWAR